MEYLHHLSLYNSMGSWKCLLTRIFITYHPSTEIHAAFPKPRICECRRYPMPTAPPPGYFLGEAWHWAYPEIPTEYRRYNLGCKSHQSAIMANDSSWFIQVQETCKACENVTGGSTPGYNFIIHEVTTKKIVEDFRYHQWDSLRSIQFWKNKKFTLLFCHPQQTLEIGCKKTTHRRKRQAPNHVITSCFTALSMLSQFQAFNRNKLLSPSRGLWNLRKIPKIPTSKIQEDLKPKHMLLKLDDRWSPQQW